VLTFFFICFLFYVFLTFFKIAKQFTSRALVPERIPASDVQKFICKQKSLKWTTLTEIVNRHQRTTASRSLDSGGKHCRITRAQFTARVCAITPYTPVVFHYSAVDIHHQRARAVHAGNACACHVWSAMRLKRWGWSYSLMKGLYSTGLPAVLYLREQSFCFLFCPCPFWRL